MDEMIKWSLEVGCRSADIVAATRPSDRERLEGEYREWLAKNPQPTCGEQGPPQSPGPDPLPSFCCLPYGHGGSHEEHLGGRIINCWPTKR